MPSGSTPERREGNEGSRVGQREELNSDEVVTGTSADPMGSFGAGLSTLKKGCWVLIAPS